jgi:spermidine/putrescine transport system permease protein
MIAGRRHLWPIAPAAAAFTLLFLIPLGYFLVVSFWRLKSYRLTPDISLVNYVEVFHEYLPAMLFTVLISLVIAAITTLLGFMIAYLARFRAGRYGPALLFIVLMTLFGGYLVKIYAWKTILGSQGILNAALVQFGVVDEPITWLLYNPLSVIITLVHFLLPFAVLPIFAAMREISEAPLAAARDLGASPRRVFIDIVLPQCRAGLFAAFSLSFLLTAGDYVTPRLVGGTSTFMIGNFIESQFINRLNAPLGSALSFSTMVVCGAIIFIAYCGLGRILKPRIAI